MEERDLRFQPFLELKDNQEPLRTMSYGATTQRNYIGPFRKSNGGIFRFYFDSFQDLEDLGGLDEADATQLAHEWEMKTDKVMLLDSVEQRGNLTVHGNAVCLPMDMFHQICTSMLGLLAKSEDLEKLAQKAVKELEKKDAEMSSNPHQIKNLTDEVKKLSEEVNKIGSLQKLMQEKKDRQIGQLKTDLHNEKRKNVKLKQHSEGRKKGQNLIAQMWRILHDIRRRPRGRRNPSQSSTSSTKRRLCYVCRAKGHLAAQCQSRMKTFMPSPMLGHEAEVEELELLDMDYHTTGLRLATRSNDSLD